MNDENQLREDSAFGPGMMFGVTGPGPKADTSGIKSDKRKEKGKTPKEMDKLPTYKEFNEGYVYVKDPFREGAPVFSKKIKIGDDVVVDIRGTIDGGSATHTAIVSVITNPIENFGEDLGKERFILDQRDFEIKSDAESFLKGIEKKIKYEE
jgi:hypothetical protein